MYGVWYTHSSVSSMHNVTTQHCVAQGVFLYQYTTLMAYMDAWMVVLVMFTQYSHACRAGTDASKKLGSIG